MKRVFALAPVLAQSFDFLQDDIGYEDLFNDALDEVVDVPLKLEGEPLPEWLDGVFFLTGPADWSLLGPVKSPNAIAGFGKVHKWSFQNGAITFSTKFPKKKMVNNVNTWLMGDKLAILTDMMGIAEVNKETLDFEDDLVFTNATGQATAGSAHPHCMDDGSYLGLREVILNLGDDHNETSGLGKGRYAVYKLHPQNPGVVQDVATIDVPRISYTHAFGLTRGMDGGVDYSVIVAQPVYLNSPLAKGNTTVHLLPMDSGLSGHKQQSIELDKFFFGHFANTFSPGPGKITFDLDRQSSIFFARFGLKTQRNKEKRDNWAAEHDNAYSTFTRYEVDLEAGSVQQKTMFPDSKTQCPAESRWCEFDMFALHPEDYGKPYCGFWAQQVYFNSSSFGAQGIVRVDLCAADGPKVVASWYQRNAYPSEAEFVPKPDAVDKTEGVLIFKIYEGDTKLSKVVVADAKTLQTLTTAVLPVRVPWTVHGNFYPRASMTTGQCMSTQSVVV